MEGRQDVLILGAGISGLALAYHLAKRGIAPLVYDPRTPAAGATGRSAGVLTEQLWDRWDVELVRETRKEYAELAAAYGPQAYRRNGLVRIASGPISGGLLDEAVPRWRSWGIEVEEPTPAELARLVPAGSFEGVASAVHSPRDAVVDPATIAAIYAEAARKAGATFDFGRPMTSVWGDGDGWEIRTPTATLRCRRLAVAAGAWSKELLRLVGHPLPVAPYRTQAALIGPIGRPAGEFPTVHDLDSGVYLRPESEGRILAGDGTGDSEVDPERYATGADAGFLAHIAEAVAERFPGWKESEVLGSWAGVCCATPDRRPLVGEVPGTGSLYVIAGFNGFGLMRAASAARRLADLISDGASAQPPLALARPDRFSDPSRKFRPRPGFTVEGGDDPRF